MTVRPTEWSSFWPSRPLEAVNQLEETHSKDMGSSRAMGNKAMDSKVTGNKAPGNRGTGNNRNKGMDSSKDMGNNRDTVSKGMDNPIIISNQVSMVSKANMANQVSQVSTGNQVHLSLRRL